MAIARNAFLLLPLCLGLGDSQAQLVPPSALDDLAWLSGTWRSEAEDGSFIEETWSAARGNAMCGMFRSAGAQGVVGLYELMAIELETPTLPAVSADGPPIPGQERGGAPQRLRFWLRHFNRGLDPWRSEAEAPVGMEVRSVEMHRLLLEAPERDFPRSASYLREGDSLRIVLESAPGSLQPRRLEFTLKRVLN